MHLCQLLVLRETNGVPRLSFGCGVEKNVLLAMGETVVFSVEVLFSLLFLNDPVFSGLQVGRFFLLRFGISVLDRRLLMSSS